MHSCRSKTHILGICTPFRCSKTSVWFRTTYFTSKTRVSGGFTPFRCRTWPILKFSIGWIKCTSYASGTISCFVASNIPNPLFQSKTHVLGGSMTFRIRTWHVAKTGIEGHLTHEFVPRKPFLVWSQRTCSIHNFRSKTHVYNSAWYLNALLQSFWRQLM